MSKPRRRRSSTASSKGAPKAVLVEPDPRAFRELKRKVLRFKPLNAKKLLAEAKKSGIEADVVLARHRTAQIGTVLKSLGVRGSKIDWELAFHILAMVVLRVGHVVHRPLRRAEPASGWNHKARLYFADHMLRSQLAGLKERLAVRAIAADPVFASMVGYKQRGKEQYSGASEIKKRDRAYRRYWQRHRSGWEDARNWFGSTDPLEWKLIELDGGLDFAKLGWRG